MAVSVGIIGAGYMGTVHATHLIADACMPGLGQASVRHDFFQLAMPDKWGYREADRRFVEAIVEGTAPPVTADDGYKAIELVEACYRSAWHDGARLRLPLEDGPET